MVAPVLSDTDLVPPDALNIDGSGNRAGFIASGAGFLWNSLVSRGGLKPEHAVLDIGSGNGRHARSLTQYLKPPGHYVGFDIVAPAVAWCQDAYAGFPNFKFDHAAIRSDWYSPDEGVDAAAYKFPYADGAFDLAFASSLFTHLLPDETINYLAESARVLKPRGRLLLTCFMMRDRQMQNVHDRTFERASSIYHVIDKDNPRRGVAYDERPLRAMVEDAGFVIAELTFGAWANGIDHLGALQDIIVAIKPD